jgi:uncharacterized protein
MKFALITLMIFFSTRSLAQIHYQDNSIKVTGSATLEFEPDEIHLIVHLKEVKRNDNRISIEKARTELYKLCNQAGVQTSDIDVSNMTFELINRRISYLGKKELDIDKKEIYDIKFTDMAKLLDLIKQLNQDYIERLALGKMTHTNIEKLREEVKIDATKNAFKKAELLAKAVERKIGQVIYIEEIESQAPLENNELRLSNSKSAYQAPYEYDSFKGNVAGLKPLSMRYAIEMICTLK